ncbi:unnamed protein product [Rotaria magnacalcarata]|uniref:Uncharacterized protein n=1 Tax=Rotaria magnacalcarata TaxID=392030 RepID=A0A816PPQ8_9BILA|nr:unnamed protein product [Rotaria magnacalcarata]CAF1374790.1 unnamed protein product [Rotaria magnacalcarata]CAF2051410.1 unnamed protein product [Rotaria magnacalcarata]CAF2052671.1 unnamed protein product [Rotaria magnacalcarata]CAF3865912.1 unnamed protein product [Rotaria magnacalcarata]
MIIYLVDALYEALNFAWRDNNDDKIFYDKLVILFTDSALNGLFTDLSGKDSWKMSHQFLKKDITLLVVGVEPTIIECYDFYCALAENTGKGQIFCGKYSLFANAVSIVPAAIARVIANEQTLYQVLGNISIKDIEENSMLTYSYMKNRVDRMIKECQAMNDIKKFFFNHRSHAR